MWWYYLQNLGMGTYTNIIKTMIAGKALQRNNNRLNPFQYTNGGVVATVTKIPQTQQPAPVSIPGAVLPEQATVQRSQPRTKTKTPSQPLPPLQIMQAIPALIPEPDYQAGSGTPQPPSNKTRTAPKQPQAAYQLTQAIPALIPEPDYTPGSGTPQVRISKHRTTKQPLPAQQTMQAIPALIPEPDYQTGSRSSKATKRRTNFKYATSNGATAVVPKVTRT